MDANSPNRGRLTWGLIILVGIVLLWSQHAGTAARQRDTCHQVNDLKTALIAYVDNQLDRAAKSLPTVGYYRQHPVELGRQLAAINRQRAATREAFAPSSC